MTLQALPTTLQMICIWTLVLGLLMSPIFGWTLARALVWKDLTPARPRGRMKA